MTRAGGRKGRDFTQPYLCVSVSLMMKFQDRAHILLDDVKTMADGYKVVRSRIARTGIQSYLGREMGDEAAANGFSDADVIRVYRPAEEVFADKSVNGWAGVPVTMDHPPELVSTENVEAYQVGDVRDKAHIDRENGWIGLEYIIRADRALKKFDSGEYAEVSGGYLADIDWTPGLTPDGRAYDARQINITPNHLALVPKGRAWADSTANKWGASPETVEDKKMTVELKTVVLGDKAVAVEAKDADTVAAILKDHAAVVADKETEIGELKAKLKDAESKIVSDADFEARVAARVESDKRREAVKAKFGDDAVKDASDAEIAGMFKVIDKAVDDTVRRALLDKKAPVNDEADSEARIAAAQKKFYNPEAK